MLLSSPRTDVCLLVEAHTYEVKEKKGERESNVCMRPDASHVRRRASASKVALQDRARPTLLSFFKK